MSVYFWLSIAVSYAIGSVPVGYLIARLWYGIDVRKHGSGNIGTTNVLRSTGKAAAVLVLLLDVGKGALGAWLGGVTGGELGAIVGGVAAVVGHNWPLFLKFKGGKGIATTIGFLLVVAPQALLIVTTIWIFIVYLTRYVSLGSIVVSIALPLIVWTLDYSPLMEAGAILLAILALGRHIPNMRRLLTGCEHRLGEKA